MKHYWASILVIVLGSAVIALSFFLRRPVPGGQVAQTPSPEKRSESEREGQLTPPEVTIKFFWEQRDAGGRHWKAILADVHKDLVRSLDLSSEQATRLQGVLDDERAWYVDRAYPTSKQAVDWDFIEWFPKTKEADERDAVVEPRLKEALGEHSFLAFLEWKKQKGRRWFIFDSKGRFPPEYARRRK